MPIYISLVQQSNNNQTMKNLIIITVIFAATVLISGCHSHTYSKTGQTVTVAPIVQNPVFKADYNFNPIETKTGDSRSVYLFGFLRVAGDSIFAEAEGTDPNSSSNRLSRVRAAAVHKALDGKSNSYLINPQYKTAVSTYFFGLVKTYRVNVTGHEATLKELRQINN
jgi:hypothetical protein